MKRLVVLGAAGAAFVSLGGLGAGGAPASGPVAGSAAFSEHWEGVWRYRNTGGTGIMRLGQSRRSIEGRYTTGGIGGEIEAEARGLNGETMSGTYCDDRRRPGTRSRCGYFISTLTGEGNTFSGSFRPWYQTKRYRWSGTRLR